MVHRKLANTASIPGRVRTAARAGALGPSAWSGQGGDDEDCVFMAEPRRWTYAASVDLGSYLKIAETAQSFLSKWPVLPPVSRLWDFLRGVDARMEMRPSCPTFRASTLREN